MENEVQGTDLERLFRENMRGRRLFLGLTQKDLADSMGVSQPVVAGLEAGRVSPTLKTIAKVAEGLSLPPDAMIAPLKIPLPA